MFTDKGIEGAGLFALPEEAVRPPAQRTMCWTSCPPEPLHGCAEAGGRVRYLRIADLIVSCGGGSVMDAASWQSASGHRRHKGRSCWITPAWHSVPIVLIPTTAGTGAEAAQRHRGCA